MKTIKFFPWVVCLYFAAVCSALATNDLILQNETISGGQSRVYKARNTITAGPSYTVTPGAALSLQAGNSVTLRRDSMPPVAAMSRSGYGPTFKSRLSSVLIL